MDDSPAGSRPGLLTFRSTPAESFSFSHAFLRRPVHFCARIRHVTDFATKDTKNTKG